MLRRSVLIGAMLAAFGDWARAEPEPADVAALEPIYGVSAARQALSIRVASTGCTTKTDFAFYVERSPSGGAALAFGRRPVEACKAAKNPDGYADLAFSYAELGVNPDAPLVVLNPMAAPKAKHPPCRHGRTCSGPIDPNRSRSAPAASQL